MERKPTIGISCIGSGVGQSVINSLRLSRLPVRTIGLGTNAFANGLYDCDDHAYTRNIYDPGYIDDLIEQCLHHRIDLIIPGHDDEALLFAQHSHRFTAAGIKAIHADEKLISICRDKELTSNTFNRIEDVFVRSCSVHNIDQHLDDGSIRFPLIAKPRSGFASRKIEIVWNRKDLQRFSDGFIFQEIAIPEEGDPNHQFYVEQIGKYHNAQVSEISIQLVFSKEKVLLGRMMTYNKLNNGIPIEILPYENSDVWSAVDRLMPTLVQLGAKGPLNFQGRMTRTGVKFFEMNARFTGLTGLRALMGFNEVEACVKEWLGIDAGNNYLSVNNNRFGIRQTADRSIPLERNPAIQVLSGHINGGSVERPQRIFITGANGYLGQNLIKKLSADGSFEIWAFGRDRTITDRLHGHIVERVYALDDLVNGRIPMGSIDMLLHCGFTRPHGTNEQIADSLRFTIELFTTAIAHQVPAIINISSQSVYGLTTLPPWTEETPVAPQMVYAGSKYSTELFLEQMASLHNVIRYSSVRLGSLSGGASGLIEFDVLSKLSKLALSGDSLHIVGGMQQLERLDIRDAVDALVSMLKTDPQKWKRVYNLGSGRVFRLKEIAERIVRIAQKHNGGKASDVIVEEKDVKMLFGMDSSTFRNDMNWSPAYSLDDTIESLMLYFRSAS